MANEIEFSFLEPQDLMTKTTYDSNEDSVVDVAKDIEGFDTATDDTFYGKVGGVTGFFSVPAGGSQAINDLTDVDTSGITIGQVLQYDGSNFVPFTITDQVGATILDELGDVDTTTTAPTSGDALVFDGTNFVPQAVSGGGASAIDDLSDVDTTGATTNNVLKYDGSNWVDGAVDYSEVSSTPTLSTVATSGSYDDLNDLPVLATVATSGSYDDLSNQPSIPSAINDLSDVDTSGITTGQVLAFDGTNFVAQTISGGGASALDDLSDVDTTTSSPTNGDTLTYNGTEWVPQAPSGGGSSTMSWERVELMYDPGFDQMNGNIQNITFESANVSATVVDGPNSVVEFTFTGKAYPPLSITTYGRADSTGEWIINSLYTGSVTRVVSDAGVDANSELFNGTFTETIRLSLDKSATGANGDDGFTYGSRAAVMFAFGE